jgi:AcrR family transcriptional regulator
MAANKKKPQNTRDNILDGAIHLFTSCGFENTPMDSIATQAGVAKGTLYYHFDSKEGIVKAIIERYMATLREAIASVEAGPPTDFWGKLSALAKTIAEINSSAFAKLHRMKYIDIEKKTITAMIKCLAPALGRLVEEGNKNGFCSVGHPAEFAEICVVASSFLFDPENAHGRSSERRVEVFIELIAKILGVKEEAAAPVRKAIAGHLSHHLNPAVRLREE